MARPRGRSAGRGRDRPEPHPGRRLPAVLPAAVLTEPPRLRPSAGPGSPAADGGAARQVGDELLGRLDQLLELLEVAYRAEISEYAALSDEEMRSTVLQISRGVAEVFFRSLRDGTAPRVEQVPGLDRIGTVRVAMGVPLEPMLHAFRVFGRVVWIEMATAAEPRPSEVLADIGGRWMDWIDRASSQAATAYLDASNELIRRLDAQRGAVLDALLDAGTSADVVAVSTRFQTTLAPTYVPVVVEGDDVAIHIDDIVRVAPPGSIAGARPSGVWVLAPEAPADPAALLAAGRACRVVVGDAAAPGRVLNGAVHAVQQLLEAAIRSGQTGVFDPGRLVLERLVLADGPATDWLEREVVGPLRAADRAGSLEVTLETYLACGSVPRTASTVQTHPNTVTYRLGRVRALTGLDPRVPVDATLLHLALVRAGLVDPT